MMLFRLLSWPYLRRRLFRWVLTLGGIALGVAVFVAMHTANQSISDAFGRTVDRIAGIAQLEVTAGEFGFDEAILERVQAIPEVGVAQPVIESTVEFPAAPQGSILILGVDLTGDRNLRDYDLQGTDGSIIDDPLVFLAQPDSLIITREFAERNHLAVHSKIRLRTTGAEKEFTIRGIMVSGGLTQAFGGNLAVMDIYAAQHALGRGRRFDRIDLRAAKGVSIEDCQAKLRHALGPGFEVEPPAARGQHFEALLRTHTRWVSIASMFALIVGMFIIYNSFAIAISERRPEIGILRALGATRSQVQRLFLLESTIAGLVGASLGTVLGLIAASAIVQGQSSAVEQVGGVAQRVTELAVDPVLLGFGVVISVCSSMVAAWIPASSAARIDPVRAIQKGKYQIISAVESRWRVRLASGLFILSFFGLYSDSKFALYAGYTSMILSALLLTPSLTLLLSKALRPVLRRTFPVEGTLAADSLISAPRRTSATVGALMLSLALVVVFGGFIGALYKSVDEWLDHEFNADFFVSPNANLTARSVTFPAELAAVIERVEGVEQVQLVRNARIVFRQVPVLVTAIETAKAAGTSRQSVFAGDRVEMNRLTASGKGTIVSQSFATIHGLGIGDVVELPAPSGALRLPVAGIVRDYSDMQGSLFIDRTVYKEWWKDDSANTARVYLKAGQPPEEVRQRILDALVTHRGLLVLTNREVHAWITHLLDNWFAMSYNQIFVAILVAVLGIANSLTVSINDRKRELAVMQALGGLRGQIRWTIWLEALSIAVIGVILSIGLGSLNLYYALDIVRRDLARLDLNYVFPFSLVLLTIPTILFAAIVAAFGPAESAVRNKLVEALEYE